MLRSSACVGQVPGTGYTCIAMIWNLHRDDLDLTAHHEVEVRVDVPPHTVSTLELPPGWRLAHLKPESGMVFLRRRQPLTDAAVRGMFSEALTFAHRNAGRFHSWAHAPELADWPTR